MYKNVVHVSAIHFFPTRKCLVTEAKKERMPKGQCGGAGFGQQLALYSLAPLMTEVASTVLGNVMSGLQRGSGLADLPGHSKLIGLPNHLPPNTLFKLIGSTTRPSRRGQKGQGRRQRLASAPTKGRRRRKQRGGIGLAGALGLSLAPMLLQNLLGNKRGQ